MFLFLSINFFSSPNTKMDVMDRSCNMLRGGSKYSETHLRHARLRSILVKDVRII